MASNRSSGMPFRTAGNTVTTADTQTAETTQQPLPDARERAKALARKASAQPPLAGTPEQINEHAQRAADAADAVELVRALATGWVTRLTWPAASAAAQALADALLACPQFARHVDFTFQFCADEIEAKARLDALAGATSACPGIARFKLLPADSHDMSLGPADSAQLTGFLKCVQHAESLALDLSALPPFDAQTAMDVCAALGPNVDSLAIACGLCHEAMNARLPTLLEKCQPRELKLHGTICDEVLAADSPGAMAGAIRKCKQLKTLDLGACNFAVAASRAEQNTEYKQVCGIWAANTCPSIRHLVLPRLCARETSRPLAPTRLMLDALGANTTIEILDASACHEGWMLAAIADKAPWAQLVLPMLPSRAYAYDELYVSLHQSDLTWLEFRFAPGHTASPQEEELLALVHGNREAHAASVGGWALHDVVPDVVGKIGAELADSAWDTQALRSTSRAAVRPAPRRRTAEQGIAGCIRAGRGARLRHWVARLRARGVRLDAQQVIGMLGPDWQEQLQRTLLSMTPEERDSTLGHLSEIGAGALCAAVAEWRKR